MLLVVLTAGAVTLAGCQGSSDSAGGGVSAADQATLSSVEATVGAVESQVASDGGG